MERLKELWDEGLSVADIAKEVGIEYWRVRKDMIAMDIFRSGQALDRYNKYRRLGDEELYGLIKGLRGEGKTVKGVYEELGISKMRYYRVLRRFGRNKGSNRV